MTPDAQARAARYDDARLDLPSLRHALRYADDEGGTLAAVVELQRAGDALRAALLAAPLDRDGIGIEAGHPEARCQQCGGPNCCWFAPSDLWNAVVRDSTKTDPMLCPLCFIRAAEAKGYSRAWELRQEGAAPLDREIEVAVLRKLLFMHHDNGCVRKGSYVDDGELRCLGCGVDFRRIDPMELERRWMMESLARLTAKEDK